MNPSTETSGKGAVTGLFELGHLWFEYDAQSGRLIWKDPGVEQFETRKGYRIFLSKCLGKPAGHKNNLGYIAVSILGRSLLCHRIIWAMAHGRDPQGDVDHRDLCRSNNRISNLREATRSQNCMNKVRRSDNHSGVKGVHWHKATQKWAASITAKGAGTRHLGVFASKDDAAAAYRSAAAELHGDFARSIAA